MTEVTSEGYGNEPEQDLFGNVVRPTFGKPKPAVCTCETLYEFVCADCRCRSFHLNSNGTIECSYCGNTLQPGDGGSARGGWHKCMEGAGPLPEEGVDPFTKHEFADRSLARRAIVRDVARWSDKDELEFIVGFHRDGSSVNWFGFETEEQRAWILKRLDEARAYVEGLELPTGTDET